MENATLLTYLAATLMEHTTSPTPSSNLRPTLPLPTARPHSSPALTARTPRIFHPMHSTGYNSQRQNTKRSGDLGGGATRNQNNGGLDRPVTGAIVIGSIFLFITMSITAAILVFCKKKNTVFIFGAGNKHDGGLYTDTSINMAPEDLLDENSDEEEDEEDSDDDDSPTRDARCGRLRENEAVALDPRLLRDPRGLELIALTTGRRDLQALYRDLFCSSVSYQQPAPDDDPTANQTQELQSRDAGQPMSGDQLEMLQNMKQQRRLPAYRVSATSKYQRMLCSALVEQRHAETANGPPSASTGDVEPWLALDSLGRERLHAQQMDPQRLGASAIAASVRDDVIRNRSVMGSVKPCNREVDLTDPSFIVNPHFSNTDPPDQETQLGSSPSHRPWRRHPERTLTVLPHDLTSLHVTLVANSGRRLVRVNSANEKPTAGFSPGVEDCGVGKDDEEEEELEETEDNALLEKGRDLSDDEEVEDEEEQEEEEEKGLDNCDKDSQLLDCATKTAKSEGDREDQPGVNQPLLTE